jgi:hypothetical protein
VTQPALASGIERLQAMNQAIERGDLDGFRAVISTVMHVDCDWAPLIAAVEGRSYTGREGMAAFFEDLLGSFEVRYLNPEFRPVGDEAVLFLSTMQMRGRESGVQVLRELGVVIQFEEGLVRRARAYDSHGEAIAQGEALGA